VRQNCVNLGVALNCTRAFSAKAVHSTQAMSSKEVDKQRLTISKVQERVSTLFNSVQHSVSAHVSAARELQKLQLSLALVGSSSKFHKVFTSFLNNILVVFKREPAVERVVAFVIKFASTAFQLKEAAAASEGSSFAKYLISYLIDCSESVEKAVRFRCCQLLAGLVDCVFHLDTSSGYVAS
jgi:hypothetical protein